MKSPRRCRLVLFACLVSLLPALPCQEGPAAPQPAAARAQQQPGPRRAVQDPVQRAALQALVEDLDSLQGRIQQARDAIASAADKAAAAEQVRKLEEERDKKSLQLNSLLVGFDVGDFLQPKVESGDLQRELVRLFEPLIQKLKEITAEPREIEEMRGRLEVLGDRLRTATRARERLTQELAALPEGADAARLRAEMERLRGDWENRIRSLEQQRTVLRAELESKAAARGSLWDTVKNETQDFFRNRGLNLLLAIAAFLAVFLGLRFLQRRVTLSHRPRDERSFAARLLEVLLHLLVVVAAVGATLITLYAMGDFLLLALALIFLLGVGWAAIRMMPQYFEQVRLLLNLGAVREGERILVDGLPWRVDAIKFYSQLSNPELQGGRLRIPLKDLIGMRSRPMADGEPWFPCRPGDFVLLSDGVRGRVLQQTPEHVVLAQLGSERTYATTSFLDGSPRNLSRGFQVVVTFGVDYEHQKESTRRIPEAFQAAVQQELPQVAGAGAVKSVLAEFKTAGASSLDVLVVVELAGEAAKDALRIERAINRILVDCCTRNGWVIPFTQITVHQAAS